MSVQLRDPHTAAMILAFVFDTDSSAASFTVLVQHVLAAASGGDLHLTKLLLQAHGDVNAVDETGTTPLLGAVENGDAPMADMLRDKGANTAALRGDGADLTAIAIRHGHDALLDMARDQLDIRGFEAAGSIRAWSKTLTSVFLTPLFLTRLLLQAWEKGSNMEQSIDEIVGILGSLVEAMEREDVPGSRTGLRELRALVLYHNHFLRRPNEWPLPNGGQTFWQLATQGDFQKLLQCWEAARGNIPVIPTFTRVERQRQGYPVSPAGGGTQIFTFPYSPLIARV